MSEPKADQTADYRAMVRAYVTEQGRRERVGEALCAHRDLGWNYSFWRPASWHRYDMQERYGFIYAPQQDPRTGFYVSVRDLRGELGQPITRADLATVRDGLIRGLGELPDCELLHLKEIAKGPAMGLEALLVFALDGETCKRQLYLLYHEGREYTLYSQGVPAEEHDRYVDHFKFIYATFVFKDVLANADPATYPPGSDPITWQGAGADGERAAPGA